MSQSLSRLGSTAYGTSPFQPFGYFGTGQRVDAQHLSRSIAPIQFERWAADLQDWRDAIKETEIAFFPYNVKLIRIYIDTKENVFVKALVSRMKELVLQRTPEVWGWGYKNPKNPGSSKTKIISRDLTQNINNQTWFEDYRSEVLESILWGFRLIELGDLYLGENNIFPELTFTRPENIRIDRYRGALLTSVPYYIDGIEIENEKNEEIKMFNHFIPTKSDRGVNKVGHGLYYNIAEYQIHLKHLLAWRMDFIENYGQPTRIGVTNKTGTARQKFESFLANPTANQYILLDKNTGDDVRYEGAGGEGGGTGTGWKNHGDAANFLQKELSSLVLGHQDALMTTAGKVGANVTQNKDGFNESTLEQAVNLKQKVYSDFEIRKVNQVSAPAFTKLSKYANYKPLDIIPEGYTYGLTNDKEDQEVRRRFNSDLESKSKFMLSFYNSGLKLKDVNDLNDMIPEFPNGFIEFEPSKKLDENRNSDTKIEKIGDNNK